MIEELKVGDKVYIRTDLKDGEFYGSVSWQEEEMKVGINTIIEVHDSGINISDDIGFFYDFQMIDREKTRELNAKDKPTFDDLIDVAVKAVRNRVIGSFRFGVALIGETDLVMLFDHSGDEISRFGCKHSVDGINFIESLYAETFVIEEDSDIERLCDGAKITLTNNEKGVFNIISGLRSITNTETGTEIMGLNTFWLKGATVTQKRGKQ